MAAWNVGRKASQFTNENNIMYYYYLQQIILETKKVRIEKI